MNREIKFRCWIPSANFMGVPFDPFDFDPSIGGFPSDAIFTQFTGLKDKKETEIYEADILQLEGKHKYQVIFEDGKFVCYHTNKEWGKWGDLSRFFDADFAEYKMCVIGNIFEHRHLLEK